MNTFNIGRYDEEHPETFVIYAQSRDQATAKHIAYMYNKAYASIGQLTRLEVLSDLELAIRGSRHRYLGEDPRYIY